MKEELNPAGMLHNGGGDKHNRPRWRKRGWFKGWGARGGYQATNGGIIENDKYQASIEVLEPGARDETGQFAEVCGCTDSVTSLFTLPEEPSLTGYVVCTLADSIQSLSVEELEALRNGNSRHKR